MNSVRAVVAGMGAVLLLAGCGAAKTPTSTGSAPAATVAQSTQPPAPSAAPGASDAAKSYVDAVEAGDPDTMRSGLAWAAAKSVAYGYLYHLANVAEANLDGGQAVSKTDVVSDGTGGLRACDTPADATTCITFADFKVDAAGKLVSLSVNKQAVGPRLTVGNGQSVTSAGAKFTFLTAYKSIQSGALFVTVKIETGNQQISVFTPQATYRSPDGKQRAATDAVGPTDIAARSNTIVAMTFASVAAGGTITLGGCAGKECTAGDVSAVFKIG